MNGARYWAVLCGLAIASICARAALVTPPQIDWVSLPSSASVGQSVSVGAGAHANASDNSDGNDWNTSSRLVVAYIKIELARPGQGWVTLADWLNPWRTPAENWASFTINSGGTHYIRISAMDGRPWFTPEYVYSINVPNPSPGITSQLSMSVNQGFTTSYQITATNSPTSFNATGIPAGLSIDTSTGVISGRITQGTTTVNSTISATNAAGTDSQTLTWNIAGYIITPNSSVSPTSTSVGVPVTLIRSGYANFGIGWFSSTIWRPDGGAESLGNQQAGSQSYTPTLTGTYSWQVRIVDTSAYNYVDQWVTFTVSGVSAPPNFQVTMVHSDSVALSWTAVTGAVGYNIYRNGTKLNGSPLSTTSYSDDSVQPGITYTYSVRAIGVDGSESPSAAVNVTTAGSFEVFTPLN